MAQLRYIGDFEARVPELGVIVEPDQVVEVDDELFNARAWSPLLWEPLTGELPSTKKKAPATNSGDDEGDDNQ